VFIVKSNQGKNQKKII